MLEGLHDDGIRTVTWRTCAQCKINQMQIVFAGIFFALRAAPVGAPPLTRWQSADSERHAPAGARPSNPPRKPRRGLASLRQERNAKRPPEGGLFRISILGGERGIRTPDRFDPIHAFQACDFNRSSTSPAFLPLSEKPRIIANIPQTTNFISPLTCNQPRQFLRYNNPRPPRSRKAAR